MPRSRPQRRVAKTVQHRVRAGERVLHAELALDVAMDLGPTTGALSRVGVQPRVEPRTQLCLLRERELLGLARARRVTQRVEPLLVVPTHPLLHRPSRAAQVLRDRRCVPPLLRQHDRTNPHRHPSGLLALGQLLQLQNRVPRLDVYGEGPP